MQTHGNLDAKGFKFALIVSRFNQTISDRLLEGAKDCLLRHGSNEKNIEVVYCPGAFEIPQVARLLSETEKYHAIISLGAVIRGETPHFEFIAGGCARDIGRVGLDGDVPVVFGVLTTDTTEQAIERSGGKGGNKGWDAALSAIEMAQLWLQFGK